MGQSASFNKKHRSSAKEGYDYTSDAIRRAPGLGAFGILCGLAGIIVIQVKSHAVSRSS